MRTIIVLLTLLAAIIPVQAAIFNVVITATSWDCSIGFSGGVNVHIEADSTGGEPEPYREHFGFRVTDSSGQIVAHNGFNHTFTPGTTRISADFLLDWKALSAVMPLTITVEDWSEIDIPYRDVASLQVEITCLEGADFLVSPIGTAANVYATDHGMEVWTIMGEIGVLVVFVPAELLAGDIPDENTLLMEADGIEIYRLDTGEYQINFPVTADGIVPVRIYDTWPPTKVYNADFQLMAGR
jgi:hypothetical protein